MSENPTSPPGMRKKMPPPGMAKKFPGKAAPAPNPQDTVKAETAAIGTHTISDTERRSYIDFCNKTLKPGKDAKLDKLLAALQLPIDPNVEDSLFQTISKGLLLAGLLGFNFPEYISIAKFNIKANSPFEININHDMTLEAAKQLGCQIVNVGATDLSAGTPHLCLGVLWQIIKKALLKNVTLFNPALQGLFNEEGVDFSKMAPEQIVMQWINHHLHKAGSDRRVKNFQSDVQDSHAYLLLLGQIGTEKGVTKEEIDVLRGQADPLVRAQGVCEIAQRILGPDETLFVTPAEIVTPNPRLNLAFAATLFNKFPNIGPSTDELMSMENKIKTLEEERTRLLATLEGARRFEEENRILKERLENETMEKESIKSRLDEVEVKAKEYFASQQGASQEAAKFTSELAELRARIETLEATITDLSSQLAAARDVALPAKQAELEQLAAEKSQQEAEFAAQKLELAIAVQTATQQIAEATAAAAAANELAAQRDAEIQAAQAALAAEQAQAQAQSQALSESLSAKVSEAEALTTQVAEQHNAILQKEEQLTALRVESEAEQARLRAEAETVTGQLAALQAESAAEQARLQQEAAAAAAAAAAEAAALASTVAAKAEEAAGLTAQLQATQQEQQQQAAAAAAQAQGLTDALNAKTQEAASLSEQAAQAQATIQEREQQMAELRAAHEAEMARLKEEHAGKLAAFAKQQDMQLQALKQASQKQKEKLTSDFESEKKEILQKTQQEVLERETTIQQTIVKLQTVESGSSAEIEELKKKIEELMAINQERKIEIDRLKAVVTQLQDLLPGSSVKEGMLTKKSGSGNRWQKRFFVLKTNFMTYYKDDKPASRKHPAGVIDLQSCGITRFEAALYPDVKLPKGSENAIMVVNSGGRKYFIQAADEKERDNWMTAVEQATSLVQKTISAKSGDVVPF